MKQYMTEQDKKAMAKLKRRIAARNYYRRAKGIPLDAPLHTHPKRKRLTAETHKPEPASDSIPNYTTNTSTTSSNLYYTLQ